MKKGIQNRLVTSMLIIGITPLVAGLYLTYLDVTEVLRNSIGANFQEMAKETANKIDMVIKREVVDAQRLALSPHIRDAVENRIDKIELIDYLNQFTSYDEKEIYSLTIVDAKGNYVAGVNENAEGNYSSEKWFKTTYNDGKGRIYIGDLKVDYASGVYITNIAVPVILNERTIGVVAIKYNIDKLLKVISNIRIEKTGHATLVDSNGLILMCPVFPPGVHNIDASLIRLISISKPGWGIAADDAHGGKDSIIGFAPVESTFSYNGIRFDGNRWDVFIRQSPDEMYAPIYSLIIRVSIVGSILIALLSAAGVYIARNIVRPINELYKGVEFIGQGKLDYRLNIKTGDEIEKLSEEINSMVEELKKTYAILEERNRELEISEWRYKDLIENSPEMIHSVNGERFFLNVNKTELNILKYTLDEMRRKRLEDIVSEEDKEKIVRHIERAKREGKSIVEVIFIAKDGRKADVEITATALYDPVTREFVRTRAFVRDITERKRLERQLNEYYETLEQKVYERTKELKETRDYLENLLETANDVIYTMNINGEITYVNGKIEEWGYNKYELIGKSLLVILSDNHNSDRLRRCVEEGLKQTYEINVKTKFGEMRYAVLSVSPIRNNEGKIVGVLGIANDITDQKRFEHQIFQTEKMSAIGQLAAGVAHEINNPLGGILNCLYNLSKRRLTVEKIEEYHKSMEDGLRRVQKIVTQLLDFSKQYETKLMSVDINSLVEEVLSLVGYAIKGDRIKIKKSFASMLPKLMLDNHKMGQVFMNIFLNAVQSIEGKGEIEVTTSQRDGWCFIEITDTGPGIPSHILPKIFDPFFTTKDVGQGTGLGLSVSRGIVEIHGGKIEVKTEDGKASTFVVKLPLRDMVRG